ncbi:MAG: hypothetical protein ACLFV4_02180 [Candidatus Hydrogenedentota bacterium]
MVGKTKAGRLVVMGAGVFSAFCAFAAMSRLVMFASETAGANFLMEPRHRRTGSREIK